MLMRVDVVRVVRTRAVILEVTARGTGGKLAQRRAIFSVRQPSASCQKLVDVGTRHRALLSAQVNHRGGWRDDDSTGIDVDDVPLNDVVSQRVVNGGADYFGGGRHPRVRRRVELDLIQLSSEVAYAVSGRNAAALLLNNRPVVEVHRLPLIRTANDLGHSHIAAADAIGKP